jgi:magnesium-protoporphyrin IX monomethyl ester (oxidative) cyclase
MVGALGEEPYPPIGLLSMAASLRVCGYEVGLLDVPAILKKKRNDAMAQNVTWVVSDAVVEEVVTRRVRDFHPNVVGISCLFSGKFRGTVSISKTVKKVYPKCVVVIGGLHPTVFAREALERLPSVDFVIIGEGEESFSNLLLAIFENQMPLSDLDGLAFRDGASIRITAKTRYIQDLDRLPLPAWEMINFDDYAIDRETWKTYWENPKGYQLRYRMPLLTSRSCPMQCRFCAMHLVHGNKIRFRSVEHCLEEIEWLYHEFGVNYFSIIDDNFTLKKRRILDLADGIVKRNIQMYLDAPSGISMHFFDHDILDALKAIGMIRLFFAIESGSDYIREKVMCKNLSRDKIYEGSELVRSEKDILVRAFFVIGMPQETEETLKASWEMIKELYIDDVSIHFATPFPGTSLYDEVIKNDLLVIPPQDAFFADEFQQSSERPFIKPYHLDIDELIDFKQRVEDLFHRRREEHGVKTNRSIKHLQ